MTTRFSQRQILILISAALVLATLVAYEPVRHNGFVDYDDYEYVTENRNVKGGITLDSVIWAFTKTYAANWHPITWISHMLDCEIYGLNPLGHHITSVLIHIANTLLLFLLLSRMTGAIWPGAFVAAVFALHPLHVESVAWVAERKDVLSTLFWMLAILAYIHYASRPSVKRYMLVLLAFVMGLMSKPMIITLPFVLLLLDYWPLDRLAWSRNNIATTSKKQQITSVGYPKTTLRHLVVEKIPLFILSAFSGVITVIAQQKAVIALEKIPLNYRIANMFVSYIKYIGKTIVPSRLAAIYPYPNVNFSNDTVAVCMLLLALITALAIYIGRRRKYVVVGWLWYVGTLVPVIGLVQVGRQAMANRYMYVPMLGLLIIFAWGVRDLVANRPRLRIIAVVLAVAVLSSAAILTRTQVGYWQNSITLFEQTLKVTENNIWAENNYGIALLKAGRFDEAVSHFTKAIQLCPSCSKPLKNLGEVFLKQGKYYKAITYFNELLNQNEDAEVHYMLADALGMLQKYDDAIKHLTKALEIAPSYYDARNKMVVALLATNRFDEAVVYLNELLRQNKDSAEANYNLAVALSVQNKNDEAIKYLSRALEINPNYSYAHYRMGIILLAAGKPNEAIKYLNKALQTNIDQGDVYENLGVAYMQLDKNEPAKQNLARAVELEPNNINTLNNLAWLLATAGDASAQDANRAVEFARRACELTGYKKPDLMDTLAVAYAAAGRFEDAVKTANKAIDIARAGNQEDLANEIQSRMKLYQAGQPYREK